MKMLSNCLPVALLALAGAAQAQTTGLQELPDDVRATVKKELARKNLMERDKGGATDGSADAADESAGGGSSPRQRPRDCTMNIGTQEKPTPGRKQVIVVATKPVVQYCGK